MRRLLLLPFLLLASAALAQDGIVSSAETDQATYAYGETIEFRYTLTNQTNEPITLFASSSCQAVIEFGPLPTFQQCTADKIPIDFAPRSSRTWVWQIIPSEHGVPADSGLQSITGAFNIGRFQATASLTAPQYLGGRLSLQLADGVTPADVRDVAEALNAEIIYAFPPIGYYEVEISGTTLEDAVATYGSDPRFDYIDPYRTIFFSDTFTTGPEHSDGPVAPAAPVLAAAGPNPFTTSTSLALTVPASGPATVEVFDLLGRKIATLHDGPLAGGVEHHFTFYARTLPAGLYVIHATGEGFTETRRVTLAR